MVCWSVEEEFLLINLYEKFPVLWKSENGTQTSIKKYEAWSEIAATLGRSVKEVQKKMGSLINLLNWEKAMIKKFSQPETGQHDKYSSTLPAFKRMNSLTDGAFLQEEVNTDTAKSDDLASGNRVPDGNNDDTRFERNHEPETSAPTNVTPNCASTPSTLKEHIARQQSCCSISSTEPVTGACPEMVHNFSIASMKDESDYFGSYVAGKLRNFDRRVRAELEHRITQVLLRVEMDRCESHVSSENSWISSDSFSILPPSSSSTPHKNQPPRSFHRRALAYNETCQPHSRSELLPMSDTVHETTSWMMNAST